MSQDNPNPLAQALRIVFGPLVEKTSQLSEPLAYGGAVVIALVVMLMFGAVIPGNFIWPFVTIVLACLVAFVYTDHDKRNQQLERLRLKSEQERQKGEQDRMEAMGTGTISVHVYQMGDKSIEIIGAEVKIDLPDPQIEHTKDDGSAIFVSIPQKFMGKRYDIIAKHKDFKPKVENQQLLSPDQAIDIYMEPLGGGRPSEFLPHRREPPPSPEKLGIPAPGKVGILIDLSHQQDRWRSVSIFALSPGKSDLISLVVPPPSDLVWDIQEIKDTERFTVEYLRNWRSLIFGIPWHTVISQRVCDVISRWVYQGGRLILTGYELGERHHRTNLNVLTDRAFGIRFNSDIVAPSGWSPLTSKPYGKEIIFDRINSAKHPILKDVKKLCMRNICTLTVEPSSSAILTVGTNGVSREVDANYTDGWTSSGTQHFELITGADRVPVIAEASRGLCGKGRVIAIGTWDFFSAEQCFKDSDNYTFVKNLLEWSVERK